MKTAILTSLLALAATTLAQTCYFAGGTVSANDVPCKDISNGGVSMCCASDEYCFSNGLCLSTKGLSFNRGSCTDQAWGPGCAAYCMGASFSGLWGCGQNNFSCNIDDCSNSFYVPSGSALLNNQLKIDLGIDQSSSSAMASATITTTATTTATAAPTSASACTGTSFPSTSSNKSSSGISTGAAAAIGVCIGGPLLLALAVALFYLQKEKRKNRRPVDMAAMHQQHPSSYQNQQGNEYKYPAPPPPFASHSDSYGSQNKPPVAEMGQGQMMHAAASELTGESRR